MRKHIFQPSMNDVLEDRLVLSHVGAVGIVHMDHAHPSPVPVVKQAVVNDVNHKVDLAFAQFNKEYKQEIAKVDRTRNETKFQSDLNASVKRLKNTLDKQAARIPGGKANLAPVFNARVDNLLQDLATKTNRSSNDLVSSDKSGAHGDVQNYIHDAILKGDLSVK